jgi:transcriptional antiterminator RfaH
MSDESAENSGLRWYCVRTQTKREHIAAKNLRLLEEVAVLCPMLRYRKATRRGKIWWREAMFPGYILARFDLASHERAVTYAQGVRGLVRFGTHVPPVPNGFVERLGKELTPGDGAVKEPTLQLTPRIDPGEEVEVAHGPLQGMRGLVCEVLPGRERVRVLLEFLGQLQPVEVDLFSLLMPRRPVP